MQLFEKDLVFAIAEDKIAESSMKHKDICTPYKIWQTDSKKNFNIGIQLEEVVHGYLSPDRQHRASLLVFGVQVASKRRNTPVKRLELRATIGETQGTSSSRPEILAHAPFKFEEPLKESAVEVENSRQVEDYTNIDAAIGVVKGGIGGKETRKEVSKSVQRYFGKGQSGVMVNNNGKRSEVWWNVKQSTMPDAKDDAGIDPNYRFAVLLTRAKNDKAIFQVIINLEIHAGLEYLFENRFSHIIQAKAMDINPRTWYVGPCSHIDRERPGRFEDPKNLVELTKLSR